MNTDAIVFWVIAGVMTILVAAEFLEAWLHRRDMRRYHEKWSKFK